MKRQPYYWLNKDSILYLERGYLQPGTSPKERIKEIAAAAEELLGIEGYGQKFEHYMSLGYYSLATPVWLNFGLERGLPISCFGISIEDTLPDILRSLGEIGTMTSGGGGTAGYFGKLRSRGSKIKNSGTTGGPVHFMEAYQSVSSVVTQGEARRGHFAAYMPIDHPDIEEFLGCRKEGHPIQTLSIAVTIPAGWMQDMIDGDKEKQKLYVKVLQKRSETGYPFLFFEDNVNKGKPQVYKDKNLDIKHSQMCVVGSERVVTSNGLLTAYELYKHADQLILFDNEKEVTSSKMHLIEKNVQTYKITLDNGLTHTVTDYHKLKTFDYVGNKGYRFKPTKCKDLVIGDKIAIQTEKGLFGKDSNEDLAYLLGHYQADGTQINNGQSKIFMLWEHDWDLLPNLSEALQRVSAQRSYTPRYSTKGDRWVDVAVKNYGKVPLKRFTTHLFAEDGVEFSKGIIPSWIWTSDEKTHWKYIQGLFEADGSVYCCDKRASSYSMEMVDTSLEFLQDLQILLNNLGLVSNINQTSKAKHQLLPDGNGGYSLYLCKDTYRISITNKRSLAEIEANTGFLSRKKIDTSLWDLSRCFPRKTAKIVSIEPHSMEDVYCVKVDSEDHYWVCNGVITHNCTEIMEYTDEKVSFTCGLSSINLLHIDEILETDAIETLMYFLNAVNLDFVKRTEGVTFMEKARLHAMKHNSVGLGVLGWHSYLQSKMIAFESMEAHYENIRIFKEIDKRSLSASKELAEIFGEPEILKGYGERFSTRLAIAPTTSSSFILGQISPSIEPLHGNYFIKDLAKGKFTYKNPFLKEVLKKYEKDTKEVWKDIAQRGGSVQHLDFLTTEEKAVFKTFGEISQLVIIQQAAARQKYIDQGQSLNLMIHPDVPLKDINALIIAAWQQGIKTLYYQRSANLAQEVSRNILECIGCES